MTKFSQDVLDVVRNIPRGEVLTYGEVAHRAGHPRAAQAVGSLMKKNIEPDIPCHRVIRADSRPGEYNRGGETAKRKLLEREGVRFDR